MASRGANVALKAIGLDSANLDFFGHPPVHPLADAYYSRALLRYGGYMARVSVAPASANLRALAETKIDVGEDFSALRDAVVAFFRDNSAEYEFKVQLCTDLGTMPIEDTSEEWPEEESPYRPVARITIPAQDAYGPARQVRPRRRRPVVQPVAQAGGAPAAALDHAGAAAGVRGAVAVPARDERAAEGGAAGDRRDPGLGGMCQAGRFGRGGGRRPGSPGQARG